VREIGSSCNVYVSEKTAQVLRKARRNEFARMQEEEKFSDMGFSVLDAADVVRPKCEKVSRNAKNVYGSSSQLF
jgi:hypothetical protein